VIATRRTLYDDLVLDEAQAAPPSAEETTRILAQAAAQNLDRALPLEDPSVLAFFARVRSLRGWMPELGLPSFDDDDLRALLPDLCHGCRSFEELRQQPLVDHSKGRLTRAQLAALEREAPERLRVPSGSWIRLVYEPGRAPVLAVRIQEVFGLADTPRVAAGRVRVVMHLLAPNHRPEQVTDDLKSFWNGAYAEVRKELSRRYPRHAWPEDPWNAPPERRPKRAR
jgi:ATP-dependent helicase HrpB